MDDIDCPILAIPEDVRGEILSYIQWNHHLVKRINKQFNKEIYKFARIVRISESSRGERNKVTRDHFAKYERLARVFGRSLLVSTAKDLLYAQQVHFGEYRVQDFGLYQNLLEYLLTHPRSSTKVTLVGFAWRMADMIIKKCGIAKVNSKDNLDSSVRLLIEKHATRIPLRYAGSIGPNTKIIERGRCEGVDVWDVWDMSNLPQYDLFYHCDWWQALYDIPLFVTKQIKRLYIRTRNTKDYKENDVENVLKLCSNLERVYLKCASIPGFPSAVYEMLTRTKNVKRITLRNPRGRKYRSMLISMGWKELKENRFCRN